MFLVQKVRMKSGFYMLFYSIAKEKNFNTFLSQG